MSTFNEYMAALTNAEKRKWRQYIYYHGVPFTITFYLQTAYSLERKSRFSSSTLRNYISLSKIEANWSVASSDVRMLGGTNPVGDDAVFVLVL